MRAPALLLCVALLLVLVVPTLATARAAPLRSFPPLPATFDFDFGRQVLYLAWAAYCNQTALAAWDCMWCGQNPGFALDAFVYSTKTESQGYVAHDAASQTMVLAFRGTINFVNIIYDIDPMNVRPYKNVSGALVHAGFYDSYDSVIAPMLPTIEAVVSKYNITTIINTGHSLGGAMAGLSAIDMRLFFGDTVPNVALINMGMPRLGNKEFSDYYATLDIETWRAVHYHDLIPHFPFRYFPIEGGYYHVPGEVWNYSESNLTEWRVCSMTDGEDPSCSDSVPVYEWDILDHLRYFGIHQNNCHA